MQWIGCYHYPSFITLNTWHPKSNCPLWSGKNLLLVPSCYWIVVKSQLGPPQFLRLHCGTNSYYYLSRDFCLSSCFYYHCKFVSCPHHFLFLLMSWLKVNCVKETTSRESWCRINITKICPKYQETSSAFLQPPAYASNFVKCIKYSNKLLDTIRQQFENSIWISPVGLKIRQTCFFTTSVNGNEKRDSLPQPDLVKRGSSCPEWRLIRGLGAHVHYDRFDCWQGVDSSLSNEKDSGRSPPGVQKNIRIPPVASMWCHWPQSCASPATNFPRRRRHAAAAGDFAA